MVVAVVLSDQSPIKAALLLALILNQYCVYGVKPVTVWSVADGPGVATVTQLGLALDHFCMVYPAMGEPPL